MVKVTMCLRVKHALMSPTTKEDQVPSKIEQELRSYVGRVVTFNGIADYIERMFHGPDWTDPTPLEGHIGFILGYGIEVEDIGDPENGPRLSVDAWLWCYVPAYNRHFQVTPDYWQNQDN